MKLRQLTVWLLALALLLAPWPTALSEAEFEAPELEVVETEDFMLGDEETMGI